MKMTNEVWNNMSDQGKYSYLKNGKKVLKNILGVDGNSKVGDVKVTKYYYIEVGGVVISHKFETEAEAYVNANLNIESWNKGE